MTVPPITEAATRSLLADLAALYRRTEPARDLITRRFIDPLPVRRSIAVHIAFALMPVGKRRVPYTTTDLLDELDRRRGEVAA